MDFLSGLISAVLWKLIQKLWDKLDTARKDLLAAERIKVHVEAKTALMKANFQALDAKLEALKVAGKVLSQGEKDEIRNERIRLETDFFNSDP